MTERAKVIDIMVTAIKNLYVADEDIDSGVAQAPPRGEEAPRIVVAILDALDSANLEVLERTEGPRENWPPI